MNHLVVNKLIFTILLLVPLWLHAQEQLEKNATQQMKHLAKSLETGFNNLKAAGARKDTLIMARSCGEIGRIYLNIVKQPLENFTKNELISTDKKVNLDKCIAYLNNSIRFGEQTGDIELLKTAYKNLSAAQKMTGNVAGALDSYRKMRALKHNSKKALQVQKKQLEYQFGKKEDSLITGKKIAENHLENQTRKLSQKELELQSAQVALLVTEKEKELQAANLALQNNNVLLQQSKLQLQQDELAKKDRDLAEHLRERNFSVLGFIAVFVIAVLVLRTNRIQKRFTAALITEKKRSEDLLLNILPAEVAEELKEKGFADAKHFYDVTVLFTDFVSFTSVAESMSPQQLVSELHVCFKAFDDILDKYQIEKIKTVGDAYMAVSGLPIANPSHAADIVRAAVDIRDFMQQRKTVFGNKTFGIRIGINSGNVVAGIVGVRKFAYDIWGDTVNVAARMEQNSEEGQINLSESTYQLVKDQFKFTYRGKVDAKNKGSIDMYYLS